ncbi:MAG: cysteine desulfurase [Ruminococcaceae bacterium]|nr:cysteine desulfurase [Oscillospiraceae bacterium]
MNFVKVRKITKDKRGVFLMKKYIKPKIDIVSIRASEDISGLADWLETEEGKIYKNAGIVVYDACSV